MSYTDSSLRAKQIAPTNKVMNLKKQLTLMLEARAMTASELSRRSKVPKQSISGWLGGSNPRDVNQIKKVADALGVSVDHLLFGNGLVKAEENKSALLDSLMGEEWLSGIFELKLRRIKK